MHYYETQQEADFNSEDGRTQLANFKERSMQAVIDDAYIKRLASENGVTVNNSEVDDAVALLREQNRLGGSDEEFRDVLREFWGWTVDDFRRELRQQLLTQKVVAKLDTKTADRARQAEARLKAGEAFAKVAAEMSDDEQTRGSGGEYSFLIDRSNPNLSPKLVDELYRLQPGQASGIVDTGSALEIVRVNSTANDKLRAAHIAFNYQPAAGFIKPLSDKQPPQRYIKLETPQR
jgi:parvulin-like peptidyl-prolyl isomerase